MRQPYSATCPLVEVLMDEHKAILRGLGVLRVVAERISKRRPVPLSELRFLVRFFREYADRIHHQTEEDLLFDPLAKRAPHSLKRMMEQLITQHVMGRFFVMRISEAVDEAAKERRGWRKKFIANAQAYNTLLTCHICSEDHHVFPIADRLIKKRRAWLKSSSFVHTEEKKRMEKSLTRLTSRYGVCAQSSEVFHHCDQVTSACEFDV